MATYSEIRDRLKVNAMDNEYSLYNQGEVDWGTLGHGRADELNEGFCHGTCLDWARRLINGNDPKKNAAISGDSTYNNLIRGHAQLGFYMYDKNAKKQNVEQQQALIDQQQEVIDESQEIQLKRNSLSTAWDRQVAQQTLLFNNYQAAHQTLQRRVNEFNGYVNRKQPVPQTVKDSLQNARTFANTQEQTYLDFTNRMNAKESTVTSHLNTFNQQIRTNNQRVTALGQQVEELQNRDLAPSTWKTFAEAMDRHMDKIAERYAGLEGKHKKKKRYSGIELRAHLDKETHGSLAAFVNAVFNAGPFQPRTCMVVGFRFNCVKNRVVGKEGGHAIAFYKVNTSYGYFLEPNFGSFKMAVNKMPAIMNFLIGPEAYGVLVPEAWVFNNQGGWELFAKDPTYAVVSTPTVRRQPVVRQTPPQTQTQTQTPPQTTGGTRGGRLDPNRLAQFGGS